jgi:26S proteasome regulatory subunit N7
MTQLFPRNIQIDAAIEEAKESEGDSEVREGMMAKAQLLARTATKEAAVKAYAAADELPKTTSGQKLDIELNLIRIGMHTPRPGLGSSPRCPPRCCAARAQLTPARPAGMFWSDIPLVDAHVKTAQILVDKGGDWERRNRLKVYEATYLISIRAFKRAASLLLDSISTFTAVELYDYKQFVFYMVVCATVALDRKVVREKVIHAPEILAVVDDAPAVKNMMNSLFHCKYAELFKALVDVVEQLHLDQHMASHAKFFLRQSRIVAYTQYLESYHTVALGSMAATFGLSTDFLDRELADLVACGRLSCKVDKVRGVVCSNRPDGKNALYQSTIKQGDALLNRIQKLSRVITI